MEKMPVADATMCSNPRCEVGFHVEDSCLSAYVYQHRSEHFQGPLYRPMNWRQRSKKNRMCLLVYAGGKTCLRDRFGSVETVRKG